MKINEIIAESFGANPYRKTTLPLSKYRGLHNPLDSIEIDTLEATILWDIVDNMIEQGVEPLVMPVRLLGLHATQDWLSSEPSDEALWDEYADLPVVLVHKGVKYILDGHNRVARAAAKGKHQIDSYVFGLE